MDEAVLADLQSKIDNFYDCITKPREAVATDKTVTKQIYSEFPAADWLLTKGLDGLSLKFTKSAPAFYQDDWNARRIVGIAATHDTTDAADAAEEGGAGPRPALQIGIHRFLSVIGMAGSPRPVALGRAVR